MGTLILIAKISLLVVLIALCLYIVFAIINAFIETRKQTKFEQMKRDLKLANELYDLIFKDIDEATEKLNNKKSKK